MPHRIATGLLVVLTIGFFVLNALDKKTVLPPIADIISPYTMKKEMIAHDEFLLLMDEGDESMLDQVLHEFDLKLITPLGEWVHVAKNEANDRQRIVAFDSLLGRQNQILLAKLEAHEAVHSAQLNFLETSDSFASCANDAADDTTAQKITPSDSYFKHQWHLSKETGINVAEAWSITTGSANTVLAIVDRNFDFLEYDWAPNSCPSRRYFYENILDYFPKNSRPITPSKETHGSNVLSVVAPCTDNTFGLSGIDWKAQVFNVDSQTDASFSARMLGLFWAAGIDVCQTSITECPQHKKFQKNSHKADVINASFGFAGNYLNDPPYGPLLDVIGHINRQKSIIVASTGNEGMRADRRLPGAAGGVISVGSSNEKRQSSSFSNFGHTVDVLAPGENILGLQHEKPILLNGTSFSSPIVAGVVSLMRAINPNLSWKQAEYILKKSADSLSCNDYCPNTMQGNHRKECQQICCDQEKATCASGIVNAYRAVRMAQQGIPEPALVDVDDYYVPLSTDNKLTATVVVKNWGRTAGIVRLKKTYPHLFMKPATVKVEPAHANGSAGEQKVTIHYSQMPKNPTVISLIFEIANSDNPSHFHDQIEAIAEIVPDPQHAKKKRVLHEL